MLTTLVDKDPKMAQAAQKVAGSLATKIPQMLKGVQSSATPRLQTFWKYAKVELRPPTPAEFPAVQKGFGDLVAAARTGKWKTLTVKEFTLNGLVAFEVACWFFVGECIGKRSIVGYQIPGAVDFEATV